MGKKDILLLQNAIKYGLMTGGLLILVYLLIYIFELDSKGKALNVLFGLIQGVVLVWGICYGTIIFRRKELNDKISYGYSLLSCLEIGVIASLIVAVYQFLFYSFFDPEAFEEIVVKLIERIESNTRLPENIMERQLIKYENYTPFKLSLQLFYSFVILTTIISLISSAFIKKTEPAISTDTI
ncbi:DUF4199 domain-containing protein [Bacteroidota bacterium]